MIVVAIIALLAAIAVPGFMRARKRSQASRILTDLRLIDSAIDQYAIENNKKEQRPGWDEKLDCLRQERLTALQYRPQYLRHHVWFPDGRSTSASPFRGLQRTV